MAVDIGGSAVGSPTGVTDSANTLRNALFFELILKILHATLCLYEIYASVIENSDSCGVVTAILKLLETVDKDLCRILLSYVTYNTTHNVSFLSDLRNHGNDFINKTLRTTKHPVPLRHEKFARENGASAPPARTLLYNIGSFLSALYPRLPEGFVRQVSRCCCHAPEGTRRNSINPLLVSRRAAQALHSIRLIFAYTTSDDKLYYHIIDCVTRKNLKTYVNI